jgi:putative ABC transport system substrate-binding protein
MLCRLRARGLVAAFALVASTVSAQVLVVLSDASTIYREAADELQARLTPLRGGHLTVDRSTVSDLLALPRTWAGYELIVTVGVAAAQRVLASRDNGALPPTLCLLVPRRAFEDLLKAGAGEARKQISAIYLDQPISRQLNLIALAMPEATRIGILFGPTSVGLEDEVREAARARGLIVRSADVGRATDVYPALQKVLRESDVLLALPDSVALNASTVRGILVTSYRTGVPVMGFSQALVDAGAVIGAYSTERQQGREGAEVAARFLAGESLPRPAYPRYFTVGVNFNAARGLGVAVDNEATLAAELAVRDRDPPASRDASRAGSRP